MDDEDRLRSRRDRRLDQALVDVEGVRPYVDEDGRGATEHDGVGGGDEGVGGQDHLVAGPELAEQGGHFERRGAGRGQEDARRAELRLHQLFDAPGEGAVTARMTAGDGLADIDEFGADDTGLVERN